ncbi:D-amino acid dehydrogenase [Azoarcus sp. L1K30]|uniref:D-amino acid dehydrogenase n=1 Tax=Azoarcus sp. L1K30 TaxID=2820277 RepID=UPI001B816AE5|nr:D-amino acid dehydrogenase [Azoarcus sp. L1K30]MBR0568164.1 D-amino acid dehydrogenase [Azoarcus sp. L1K30]
MDITIVGGGIIGLTSAWYLRADGHQVTLVDACDRVGQGASHANGGQLSYRYVAPLAEPGVLAKIPGWMLRSDAPIRFKPAFDSRQWSWIGQFLRACNGRDQAASIASLLPLSLYSRRLMDDLRKTTGFDFAWRRNGKLVLHRNPASFAAARRLLASSPGADGEQFALDVRACLDVEPALERMAPHLAGGIHTPSEEVGDCLALCQALEQGLRRGPGAVTFRMAERVERIELASGRYHALQTDHGRIRGDACVIANGADATSLLHSVGVRVPIYPVKGYSISAPLVAHREAPEISITDFQRKVVYARIGDHLRVAGMADIVGHDRSIQRARIDTLKRETAACFGMAADLAQAREWSGLRPATPTGMPIIGASKRTGIWLNLGHGALGFTLAAGSARVLADRVGGRTAAIPDAPFSPSS